MKEQHFVVPAASGDLYFNKSLLETLQLVSHSLWNMMLD